MYVTEAYLGEKLSDLIGGCDEDWDGDNNARSFFKYDSRHWLAAFGRTVEGSERPQLFRWLMAVLAGSIAVVLEGEYEFIPRRFIVLGVTPEEILSSKRRTVRKHCMTHQPEAKTPIRRLWGVPMCAWLIPEPGRTGLLFLAPKWLHITEKELRYVKLGLLSDKSGVVLYVQIGTYRN